MRIGKSVWRISFILGSFLVCTAGMQIPTWKGNVKYENNVKIVSNPSEPAYGDFKFELKKLVNIGNDKDQNYLFYRISDVNVDREQNIYVLESGNKRIQKFDKNGRYLQTIGRRGQGPGEFEDPSRILIDNLDNICVLDGISIEEFDNSGKYLRTIIGRVPILDLALTLDGVFIAKINVISPDAGSNRAIVKLDSNGALVKTIAQFPFGLGLSKRGMVETNYYRFDLFFAALSTQKFVYAYSREYKLIIADVSGRILSTYSKVGDEKPVTGKEKTAIKDKFQVPAAIKEKMVFPKNRPYFNQLMCDDEGHIYVIREKSVLDSTRDFEIDIFNKDGCYVYSTRTSQKPYLIKEGIFYTVVISEETGQVTVKCFEITNWKQLHI